MNWRKIQFPCILQHAGLVLIRILVRIPWSSAAGRSLVSTNSQFLDTSLSLIDEKMIWVKAFTRRFQVIIRHLLKFPSSMGSKKALPICVTGVGSWLSFWFGIHVGSHAILYGNRNIYYALCAENGTAYVDDRRGLPYSFGFWMWGIESYQTKNWIDFSSDHKTSTKLTIMWSPSWTAQHVCVLTVAQCHKCTALNTWN